LRSTLVPVDDSARVSEVRRVAVASAQLEGLAQLAADEVAIVATELATNLLKHARSGEVHIRPLSLTGDPGIEVLSIDRGPGIADLAATVVDGFSTTATAGTGLGAVARLSDVFDAYSEPSRGTVAVARKFRGDGRPARWTFGAVQVPFPGEVACGDNWSVRRHGSSIFLIVADGLGHGILAAEASGAAVKAFQTSAPESPAAILDKVHLGLRATRGAAVAVTQIDAGRGVIRYAGLGNISGVLLGGGRTQFMVSHNGTAGLEARRVQQFEYPMPAEAVIVMHSDGVSTNWSANTHPGLLRRHPSVIAGWLYREASRGRDDACVVAGRFMQE